MGLGLLSSHKCSTGWGKRRFTVGSTQNTEFVMLLFIIFHTNDCKPTFTLPCVCHLHCFPLPCVLKYCYYLNSMSLSFDCNPLFHFCNNHEQTHTLIPAWVIAISISRRCKDLSIFQLCLHHQELCSYTFERIFSNFILKCILSTTDVVVVLHFHLYSLTFIVWFSFSILTLLLRNTIFHVLC